MENKPLAVELKDAARGAVRARFAMLGVVDHDGDIIVPGAFGEQKVRVSAYNHGSWQGAPPVGKGTIHEEGGAAIADLQFFMTTQHGREHFEVVKELGELGEWSFGFDILERAEPSEEQRRAGARRVLKRLRVHEVSPVLLGAGVGTATLTAKAKTDPPPTPPAPSYPTSISDGGAAESIEYTEAPPDVARLAAFIVKMADMHHRAVGPLTALFRPPVLKFFRPNGSGTKGFVSEKRQDFIAVRADLTGADLASVVCHEFRHLIQAKAADVFDGDPEADAEGYAAKWSPVYLAAHRACSGLASGVSFKRGAPPYGNPPAGSVVVRLDRPEVWQYNPRNTGPAWNGVTTR